MNVTFLLPSSGRDPSGGFKVVYTYANGLVARGHAVTLVHPARIGPDDSLLTRTKCRLRYFQWKLAKGYGPRTWFRLDPAVRVLWVPGLDARHVPEADAVVATAWRTAEWAAGYRGTRGRGLYLIQHLETWSGPKARVMATWKLPLRKLVISRWLEQIARETGEYATYVPNGIDFAEFGTDVPAADRDPASVMMLHHDWSWKGTADGLQALSMVRQARADLRVTLFGVREPRESLPPWVSFHARPGPGELRALYNQSAVFVSPSHKEGWGLPPAEAMACGCALAVTDIGGHREFAVPGRTALLSPPRDPAALADNVLKLIGNRELRLRLSDEGRTFISSFTWERSLGLFENALRAAAV